MQTFTFQPNHQRGLHLFAQQSKMAEVSAHAVRSRAGLGDGGFDITGGILSLVGGAASTIANAFASGSVADSQARAAKAQADAAAAIAMAQSQAQSYKSQALTESMPYIAAGIIGLGVVLYALKK